MKYKIGDKVEFTDFWTAIHKGKIINIKTSWFTGNKYLIRYTPYIHVESATWIDENNVINKLK